MPFQRIPDELLARATPQERAAYAKALRRHLALSNPMDFALQTRRGAIEYPHTRYIADAITEIPPWGGLIVFMGPRHGKSYIVSETAPAWALAQKAAEGFYDTRVLHATYAHDFMASKIAPKVHGLIKENLPLTPRMHPRHQGMTDFLIHPEDGSGFYFGTGVDGPMTGMGADYLFLDDLIKNHKEAKSALIRENAWDWYVSVAEERLEPGGRTIYVGTPWHEDDVGQRLARMYENDPRWRIIRLPSIAEEEDPLGRAPGEALCPDRYPIEELERKRRKSPTTFAAMHQGRPSPEEGDVFKGENLLEYTTENLPEKGFRFATCDLAHSLKTRADWSVITCFLLTRGVKPKLYVTHMFREKVDSGEHMEWLDKCMASIPAAQRPSFVGVEDKTFGSTLLGKARREGRRGKVMLRPLEADTDKVTRAQAAVTFSTQGQLLFPNDAPWLAEARHELLLFPNGTHDDIVDTISYAGIVAAGMPLPREQKQKEPIDRSAEKRAAEDIKRRQKAKKPGGARRRKSLLH